MNVVVSIETHPYNAAHISEGCFNVPACKLNSEMDDPAVLVVMDCQRAVIDAAGQRSLVPVLSSYLVTGDGTGGIFSRDGEDRLAAYPVPRYFPDPPDVALKLKLLQARSLKEALAAAKGGYPPPEAFPTHDELKALYKQRVARDRYLIDLGDKLYSEHHAHAKFVPLPCLRALVRLAVHRPWENFSIIEAIDEQKKFFDSLQSGHPLYAIRKAA